MGGDVYYGKNSVDSVMHISKSRKTYKATDYKRRSVLISKLLMYNIK